MNFKTGIVGFLTWRRIAVAEGYAGVLLFREWLGLDAADRFGRYMAVETLTYVLAALLFLPALDVAEKQTRHRARRAVLVAVTLLMASLASALIFTSMWFDLKWRNERNVILFILENAMEFALWGSLGILVFYNRAQAVRVRDGLKQAQMMRARREREVLESKLDAARNTIDGPALFEELTQIRDALRREEPQAAEALERLVARLRSIHASPAVSYGSKGAT